MKKNLLMKSVNPVSVGDALEVKKEELKESLFEAFRSTKDDVSDEKELFKDVLILNVSVDEEDLKKSEETEDETEEEPLLNVTVEAIVTESDLDLDIKQNTNSYINDIPYMRMAVAKRGYGLDSLMNDSVVEIRCEVVRQHYKPEVMIEDSAKEVRMELARQNYGLPILVKDPSSYVRTVVAEMGYGCDILVNDPDSYVRAMVARKGYGLDILVEDECPYVRKEVALQGYGHEILMNDLSRMVREAVCETATEDILSILVDDESEHVKEACAKRGFGLSHLVQTCESSYVRAEVARNVDKDAEHMEELCEILSASTENWRVRLEIAKHGYEPCLKDGNVYVRRAAYEAIQAKKAEATV